MKILVAENAPLVLEGLRSALDEDGRFDVVSAVSTGPAVLPAVARSAPDAVLLDARLPGIDGFDCLLLLRERHPEIDAVLLADAADDADLVRAFSFGAAAVIVRTADDELPDAIYDALTGGYRAVPRLRPAPAMGLPAFTATAAVSAA